MKLKRLKLKEWIYLEETKRKIFERLKDGENVAFMIYEVIELATGNKKINRRYWKNTISIFNLVNAANKPTKAFALTDVAPGGKIEELDLPWDYDGRTWYSWSHTLADAYGWDLEYISNLEIDDAVGLMQEIMTSEQMDKEFNYSLSEIAYPYDKNQQKGIFKPLPRPNWMAPKRPEYEKIPKIKIPKKYIPIGNVVKYDEKTAENKKD